MKGSTSHRSIAMSAWTKRVEKLFQQMQKTLTEPTQGRAEVSNTMFQIGGREDQRAKEIKAHRPNLQALANVVEKWGTFGGYVGTGKKSAMRAGK